jgi:hypothetical protein
MTQAARFKALTDAAHLAGQALREALREMSERLPDACDHYLIALHPAEELYEHEGQPPRLVCRGCRNGRDLTLWPTWPCIERTKAQRRIDSRAATRRAEEARRSSLPS